MNAQTAQPTSTLPSAPLFLAEETWSVIIRSTAAEAKKLSAITSPTRNFEPFDRRGVFAMHCDSEVLAIRDADFLTRMGANVLGIERTA